MNLLLFHDERLAYTLPASDERYHYLRNVLRAELGGTVSIGVAQGRRGLAKVTRLDERAIDLVPVWEAAPPPAPAGIELLLGLPRPQTARRILYDAASLGVARLRFFRADKTAPGYSGSRLWLTREWLRRLEEGAEQGFTTWLPDVVHHDSLRELLDDSEYNGRPADHRIALDPYEASGSIGSEPITKGQRVVLAIGPEGGWSEAERVRLRADGFSIRHLGSRILRMETAVVSAVALVEDRIGAMDDARGAVLAGVAPRVAG